MSKSWVGARTIGISLDLDNGLLSSYIDGVFDISFTIPINSYYLYLAWASSYPNKTNIITNFGVTPFDYSVPLGYHNYDGHFIKMLIQDGIKLKTISDSTLVDVCNSTDSDIIIEQGFINSGMDNLSGWSNSLMNQIETKPPKVLIYKK